MSSTIISGFQRKEFLILILFFGLIFSVGCDSPELLEINIIKNSPPGWTAKEECGVVFIQGFDTSFASASIKCRGGMSSKYSKHSYALELDSVRSLNGMSEEDDWILNASYIDKTFMRHKLSYDIFSGMSEVNKSAKSEYVKLKLNSEYKGLYLLMKAITASSLGLNKADLSAQLYKDPPIFRKKLDTDQRDTVNVLNQKFPKWNIETTKNDLWNLREFILTSCDQEFVSRYDDYIDLSNIIDWHLLLMLSNGGDGVLKNFYIYKLDQNTPFRIAIWDCDHSFGRDGDNELNLLKTTPNYEQNILLKKLLSSKGLKYIELLKKRWHELRKRGAFSEEKIASLMKNMESSMQKEINANAEKWPLDSKWYYDQNSYENEVELMKKFIRLNLDVLDRYF
ncbi:MAG: CotH kinase family protein [Flavobacteriales bacterium]